MVRQSALLSVGQGCVPRVSSRTLSGRGALKPACEIVAAQCRRHEDRRRADGVHARLSSPQPRGRGAAGGAKPLQAGAGLVALPEYFCLLGRQATPTSWRMAEAPGDGRDPGTSCPAPLAREHGIWLVGGTLANCRPATANGRVLNRNAASSGPTASLAVHYDKMHLFAYDNGREAVRRGAHPAPPAASPWHCRPGPLRVGLSICYDLRFPELYRSADAAALRRAQSFPPPSPTPPACAHWELLLRARASRKPVLRAGRRRRAARTRTAAAPGATAWWSIPGARWWRCAKKAKAW